MSGAHGVSVKFSDALLARLDGMAASWGLSRAATVRRLVELAEVAAGPVGVPTMDELVAIASEKARNGNMAAVSFLAARQPDDADREWQAIVGQFGSTDD